PATPSGAALFGVIQAMASSLRVEVNHVNVREATDVGRAVTALAQSSNGGLIVLPAPSTVFQRDLIIELAAQYRLPAVYFESAFLGGRGRDGLGAGYARSVAAACRLRRSHPQGREACRPAGAGPNQIRAGHQPEDRQSARIDRARQAARPRRRGDRVM